MLLSDGGEIREGGKVEDETSMCVRQSRPPPDFGSVAPNSEGGSAVAFAAAAPLMVLAVAVAADHAHVARSGTQVQLAAGAASLAAAGAVARHPESGGESLGARAAGIAFARNAPRGASSGKAVGGGDQRLPPW